MSLSNPSDLDEAADQASFGAQEQTAVVCESTDNPSESGCPECQNPNYDTSTWCNRCGYYALLRKCIELSDGDSADGEQPTVVDETPQPKKAWVAIPAWSLQLAGAVVVVGGCSVAGRFLTVAETPQRWNWSIIQVVAGWLLFLVAHVRIALIALRQNRSLQISDAIMTPLRVWLEACMDFQRVSGWLAVGLGGLWAVILAHVLLGVPYGRMFTHEEAPVKKEKTSSGGSGMKMGTKSKKNMTMEEAMKEFGDKAGAKKLADQILNDATSEDAKEKPFKVETLDCTIIGYKRAADGRDAILSLVVATQDGGQWKVLGMVHNGLTPEIQAEIGKTAPSLHRGKPIVECKYSATWLEPVLGCQIEAEYPAEQAPPNRLKLIGLK